MPNTDSSSVRYPGLDLLRTIAITLVVVSHYPYREHAPWYTGIRQYGWSGVDLFFVLSGYLIGFQIFNNLAVDGRLSFRDFYIKRTFRILPCYLVVVAVYFLFPGIWESEGISPLWKYLSFTQNFGLDFGKYGTFSHAWSLCVEEHFYLCLPIIAITFVKLKSPKRYVAVVFGALFVFGVFSRWFSWNLYFDTLKVLTHPQSEAKYFKSIYYPTYNHLEGLLVGVGLALTHVYLPQSWRWFCERKWPVMSLGLAFLALALKACVREENRTLEAAVFGFPLFAMAYGCFVQCCLSSKSKAANPLWLFFAWTASLAYSTYLTHKPVIKFVHEAMVGRGFEKFSIPVTLATILAVLFVACVLHYCVERPFLKLRSQLLKK